MHDEGAPGDDPYMTPLTHTNAGIAAVGLYRIDPTASSVTFKTRHLFGLGRARGSFELKDGEIHVAGPVGASWAEARVSTASFQTGSSARDSAVLSRRLLDACGYPFITFSSTAVDSANEARALHGQLTVCGTTAPLDLNIQELETGTAGLRLRATSRVDRYAFGVTKAKGWAGRRRPTLQITAPRERCGLKELRGARASTMSTLERWSSHGR
jgi:polyisoprenoid-binding protein YceI